VRDHSTCILSPVAVYRVFLEERRCFCAVFDFHNGCIISAFASVITRSCFAAASLALQTSIALSSVRSRICSSFDNFLQHIFTVVTFTFTITKHMSSCVLRIVPVTQLKWLWNFFHFAKGPRLPGPLPPTPMFAVGLTQFSLGKLIGYSYAYAWLQCIYMKLHSIQYSSNAWISRPMQATCERHCVPYLLLRCHSENSGPSRRPFP